MKVGTGKDPKWVKAGKKAWATKRRNERKRTKIDEVSTEGGIVVVQVEPHDEAMASAERAYRRAINEAKPGKKDPKRVAAAKRAWRTIRSRRKAKATTRGMKHCEELRTATSKVQAMVKRTVRKAVGVKDPKRVAAAKKAWRTIRRNNRK